MIKLMILIEVEKFSILISNNFVIFVYDFDRKIDNALRVLKTSQIINRLGIFMLQKTYMEYACYILFYEAR